VIACEIHDQRAPAGAPSTGFAPRFFEIVFEGDPFVTAEMRRDPAFSVGLWSRAAACQNGSSCQQRTT
jgi:hypothetical protein